MIRFLLDEHVPHAIARGLRLRGVEATTLSEAGLLSKSDKSILQYALQHNLVLFTQDDDFLRLNAEGLAHAGIVYSRQGQHKLGEVVQFLKLIAESLEPAEIRGCVEHF